MEHTIRDILICDDHPICQMGLECNLKQSLPGDLLIRKAHSRETLLKQMSERVCDLLFLDLQLPDSSGLGLVQDLVEKYPLLPIVVVTSCDDRGQLQLLCNMISQQKLKGLLWKTHSLEHLQQALASMQDSQVSFVDPDVVQALEQSHSQGLTQKEWEVLALIAQGLTNEAIAKKLSVSIETVKTHRAHLGQKTDSRNRAELTAWYLQRNGVGHSRSSASL